MVKYARNLTILQKRKKTAHAYFGRLYFLAGKLRHSKQMLLTEFHESEKSACVFWAPVFSKFFGGKTKFFSNSCYRKKPRTLEKVFFWPLVQTWLLMRLLSSGVFSSCRPFNNLQERGTTEVINKSTISNLYSLNHSKANQLANFIIIRVRSSLARSRPLML